MSELIDCINNLSAKDIIKSIAKTANGVPFYLQTVGAGGMAFCAAYQTVYDSLTTKPSDVIAAAQNIMCCALVDAGIWTKLDVFYLYAQTTNGASEALVNWVNPGTYDASLILAPAFVALEGFAGNGVTVAINWNWKPKSNGVNYTQDNASTGCYIRTDVQESKVDIGCEDGTDRTYLISRHADGNAYNIINAVGNNSVASAASTGMFVINRVLSTHQDLYRNKIRIINGATASSDMPDREIYSLARNNDGLGDLFSSRQLSVAFGGGGLTTGEITILTDAIEVYMDSNGRGVIP